MIMPDAVQAILLGMLELKPMSTTMQNISTLMLQLLCRHDHANFMLQFHFARLTNKLCCIDL